MVQTEGIDLAREAKQVFFGSAEQQVDGERWRTELVRTPGLRCPSGACRGARKGRVLRLVGRWALVTVFSALGGFCPTSFFCVAISLSFCGWNFFFCGKFRGRGVGKFRSYFKMAGRERCLPLGCLVVYQGGELRAVPNG